MNYDPKKIEKHWQKYWEKNESFKTPEKVTAKDKFYILPQLPYPSGSGLHVGHAEVYTACDIYARYQRMKGKKVLQVFGLDSFGLPAENYAIKTNVHPKKTIDQTGEMFVSQVKSLGVSVDWDRFVRSSDPDYYKWTQWFFLLMYERGLAYRKKQSVNWCDGCKTVLANEQVVDGKCERSDDEVVQRDMEQWYLKITDYADRLDKDLDKVDWPEETKRRQRNWIGRSEGANFKMKVKDKDFEYKVYDSVPQTYTAQTFAVIAPEHRDLPAMMKGEEKEKEVMDFVAQIKKKKMEGNKFEVEQEIEGVFTGLYMDDPYGTGDLPLWVASFAIADYGSGVVGCSAHDERDFAFAKKYNIPLRPVMFPEDKKEAEKVKNLEYCYHHDAEAVLSSPKEFKGRKWGEVREDIINFLVDKGMAERAVQYKLRDWSVSRQRFWGAPVPMLINKEIKEEKRQYVLIHGYTGSSDGAFNPWLKKELEDRGHKVWCEDLPNTDNPNAIEQAEFILGNTNLDKNSVIVAHSHGGPVVFRLLERIKNKVAKVVLVDTFYKPEFTDKKRPPVEKSDKYDFDFKSIKTKADEFTVLHDSFGRTIGRDQAEDMAKMLDAELFYRSGNSERHFKGEVEPDVLDVCLPAKLRPVPEKDLPVLLPDDVDFKPTGESPLNYSKDFQKGVDKKYGKGWKREVDTLDTFMCSSWYYFRYLDPHNDKEFAGPKQLKKWMPVDFYLGGEEHVNGHLLYARFFTKVLFDAGYIDFDEPFTVNRHQGLILGEDNRKMSKRWGNVINPSDVVDEYGADTCRVYEMFMGPLEDTKPWSTDGVKGVRRFLERVWRLQDIVGGDSSEEVNSLVHKTIKKVGEDLDKLKFNTAIAKLMELSNAFTKEKFVSKENLKVFSLMLAPFAPHLAEELWKELGNKESLAHESWPKYDENMLTEDEISIVVQVNGKVRANLEVSSDISEDEAKEKALAHENVIKWMDGKKPKKVIYIKNKLISIVV